MLSEFAVIINLGIVISAVIGILAYFNQREKARMSDFSLQRQSDEKQNTEIELLKLRVNNVEKNSKELKDEILQKVDKVDHKVDDMKQLLITILTKQSDNG